MFETQICPIPKPCFVPYSEAPNSSLERQPSCCPPECFSTSKPQDDPCEACVKDAEKHGLSEDDIARVLGYSNPYRVTMLKRNGRIYTLEELSDIIHSLYELDKKIKTGYNPVYGLKEFLLDL